MRKVLLVVLACSFLLAGCGSSSYSESATFDGASEGAVMNRDKSFGLNSINSSSYEAVSEDSYSEEYSDEYSDDSSKEELSTEVQQAKVNKDMLVFRGNIEVTTKDYDKAMSTLNKLYDTYDCFIENSEEYGNTIYDDNEVTLMNYRATIRVASEDYDAMLNGISSIGVVSRKNSSVENLNNEYSDVKTALEIYRAREQRYLEMLKECTDDYEAVRIEDKLTELQIQVAQYESRKRLIETDVAYSYITVDIEEVQTYSAQIKHTDNFFVRLWKQIVNSLLTFLTFIEGLLFFVIDILPFALFIGLIYLVIRKTRLGKKLPKIKIKKKNKKESTEDSPENNGN